MTDAPRTAPPQAPIGRIPVQDVRPVVDDGARPAKSVVGETFVVTATVFREGHDAVNATVVLADPDGVDHPVPMTCTNEGLNTWQAPVTADRTGWWTYRVEGWSDPYGTWHHDATIKVAAGVDVELMLEEGARLLERCAAEVERSPEAERLLLDAVTALRDTSRPPAARIAPATDRSVREELHDRPLREMVSPSTAYPLLVERERALAGAWYEIFPRSEGARQDPVTGHWTSGTLRTAAERLAAGDRRHGLRRRLPHAHPPHRHDRAQGPEQHPRRRTGRPGQPVCHRLARRRARQHPSRPRDVRGLRRVRRPRGGARPRCGPRPRAPVLARPPLRPDQPRVVHDAGRRHDRLRGEPAEEVPGHLSAQLRQRPGRRVCRDAARRPGVARPRRADLPRRQPPHQAGRVLAVDHRRRREGLPRDDLARGGLHQARHDAHPRQSRLPAVVHVLRVAQRQVGDRGVPPRAVRRRRRLHAPVVLADDPRHPHALHAVRRADGVEAARRPRRDARADLRHLCGVRARRARRPPRGRGADRQREVPVQGPALGGLRAGGPQGGSVARRLPHDAQPDPASPPRARMAAEHHLPPRRRRERHLLLQAAASPPRGRGPRHRRREPRPALDPLDDGAPRHAGPRDGLERALRRPRPRDRRVVAVDRARLRPAGCRARARPHHRRAEVRRVSGR
ncbi:hypothetical protein BN12_350022 [Nostocoides japonicum T1-X7]|uniref:Alpha-1,4-glucan:maltose-1-phosphate maltosyltransferase domain-containing protein n=1 Tax=Nostocoides japonicum T1-X7 TaxID=1194083 RepID=A0A077LYV5_9MICO|nr:hypothetical protein BN12_350022 [Tetrasphaera japonica T1-X7]